MASPKKTPATKPAAKSAKKPEALENVKPAAKRAAAKSATKPAAPKKEEEKLTPKVTEIKETLTPEEKERLKKLQATMAMLQEDPEWDAFLEEQKEALYQLRDELLPNMQNVTRDHLRSGASNVSSSSGQHIGDAGSEAEVRDLTIRLLDKDREQIFEIDAALQRIPRGTYGICEESLEPIPKGRLRVRPFCRLTVKCQEEYEKKYGAAASYKSQNSNIIGYAGIENESESAISLDEDEE